MTNLKFADIYPLLDHFPDINVSKSGMQRNVSAPVFADVNTTASTSDTKFDPFAEFLASTKDISSVNAVPKSKHFLFLLCKQNTLIPKNVFSL